MIKSIKPTATANPFVSAMARKDARAVPTVSLKRPMRTGTLVKSLVEKFEKKSQPPVSKEKEPERSSISEPINERQTAKVEETYDFSSMQQMNFFTDSSFEDKADTSSKEESVPPELETPNLEFQTSFDFVDPFIDPFEPPIQSSLKAMDEPTTTEDESKKKAPAAQNIADNSLTSSETVTAVSPAVSKMCAKLRQKIVGEHGNKLSSEEVISPNSVRMDSEFVFEPVFSDSDGTKSLNSNQMDQENTRISLAPSSLSLCHQFNSPPTGERPRISKFNPEFPLSGGAVISPSTGQRPHISMVPDLTLSSPTVRSPGSGNRPRISMIPDIALSSATVKSPGTGLRSRLSIASDDKATSNVPTTSSHLPVSLSPTNDSSAFHSVAPQSASRKPRITMVSTAKSPKTPGGRRRIALAPVVATNESPNVKVLISRDDMKSLRLSLSSGERLDPSSGQKSTFSGGSGGNPKRIAIRSKDKNGAKRILCMESLQALLSQAESSSLNDETRSTSTPRQGQRRTSLTMTPITTKSSKARVTPLDLSSLKDPESTFQKQRRRHSFSASTRALFAEDAAESMDGFGVITDRAGQSIAPSTTSSSGSKTNAKRKSKKKRDAV